MDCDLDYYMIAYMRRNDPIYIYNKDGNPSTKGTRHV